VLVNVARRSNRLWNCPVRPGDCPGARRAWSVFLQSRYKADRAKERSRYKFYKWLKISHGSRTMVNGHMRSIAVQVVKKPEIGHGIEFNLRADARVRVHKPPCNCHVSRRKSKNRDKFIDTTDRVSGCYLVIYGVSFVIVMSFYRSTKRRIKGRSNAKTTKTPFIVLSGSFSLSHLIISVSLIFLYLT
jgi:hypothetical protein